MSTFERKKLGINKSTLWYEKKKLSEGKKIKVYNKVLAKFVSQNWIAVDGKSTIS